MANVYVRGGHALCRLVGGLHLRLIRPLLGLRRSNYGLRLRLRKRSLWAPNFSSPRERDRFILFWPLAFPLHLLLFVTRLVVEIVRVSIYWLSHHGRFAEPSKLDESDPSLYMPPAWAETGELPEGDELPAAESPAPGSKASTDESLAPALPAKEAAPSAPAASVGPPPPCGGASGAIAAPSAQGLQAHSREAPRPASTGGGPRSEEAAPPPRSAGGARPRVPEDGRRDPLSEDHAPQGAGRGRSQRGDVSLLLNRPRHETS